MNRYLKFGIPVAAILATCVWLGFSSTKQSAEYFKEIPELKKLDAQARSKNLLVNGYVKEGSIVSAGQTTTFVMVEHEGQADLGEQLKVIYTGNDLPDTFKAHAQALAGGKLGEDGVFYANKLQAKCASKYEAAPPKLNTPDATTPAPKPIQSSSLTSQPAPIQVKGTVTKVEWTNPIARFYLDVTGAGGTTTTWNFGMGTPNSLLREGWTRNALKAGDVVTASGSPINDGSNLMYAEKVTLESGRVLYGTSSPKCIEDRI